MAKRVLQSICEYCGNAVPVTQRFYVLGGWNGESVRLCATCAKLPQAHRACGERCSRCSHGFADGGGKETDSVEPDLCVRCDGEVRWERAHPRMGSNWRHELD